MKHFLILVIASLALAGCVTAQQVNDTVSQVRAYTSTACAFIPTVATITSLFSASAGATISTVGSAICNAVAINPLSDGPTTLKPVVNGVRIRGEYLNGRKL